MSDAPTDEQIQADIDFAVQTAREAGQRLMGLRDSGRWPDEKIMGDVGDQAADGYLQGYLRGRYPQDGILSEETKDSAARLERSRTWIVDPLDGTKEYRSGREDFAVHVALTIDGAPAVAAVGLPALDRVLWGCALPGRERGGTDGVDVELHLGHEEQEGPTRIVVSRSHTPEWVERFADVYGPTELVRCGSVGYKASRILLGEADMYIHKRGLKEWDTCAPEVVARALGWHVCRIDGSTQRYNQADPYNDEIVICRPAVAERALAAAVEAGVLQA